MNSIDSLLFNILKEKRMSKKEAAELLDCSPAYIGKILKRERFISYKFAYKIHKAFGGPTPDQLMSIQTKFRISKKSVS